MLPVEAAAVSSTRSVGNVPSEEVARIKPQGAPPTCDQRPELAEPASALGHPLERRGDHTEEKAGPGELPGKRGHFPSQTLWLCQDRPCTLRSFPPGVATQRGAGSRGAGREGLTVPRGLSRGRPPRSPSSPSYSSSRRRSLRARRLARSRERRRGGSRRPAAYRLLLLDPRHAGGLDAARRTLGARLPGAEVRGLSERGGGCWGPAPGKEV